MTQILPFLSTTGMWQHINYRIGFFDPGTSDPGSSSLWFPSNITGTPVLHKTQEQMGQAGASLAPELSRAEGPLLPTHRTLSGGLLFTLPDAGL